MIKDSKSREVVVFFRFRSAVTVIPIHSEPNNRLEKAVRLARLRSHAFASQPGALRRQCLGKPFRGQVAAQPFFAGSIEDETGDGSELPAELVITRFVGKQRLLARSSSFDPLPEEFAGLDRARGQRRDPGILDVLRT